MKSDKNPLVSVIIPTYNRACIISETLTSVQNQTYQDWECIVVDDGSDDDTDELMKDWICRDSRFKFYKRNRDPKGAPTCRNIGLEKTKGEYLFFLDSDDLLLKDCIKNRIKHFFKDSNIDLLIAFQKRLVNGVETFLINVPTEHHPLIRFYTLKPEWDIPWVNNCLIRKEFLLRNSIRWEESLKLHQDIQFNIKLLSFDPIVEWTHDSFDSYWVLDGAIKNMGGTNWNKYENLVTILRIYWTTLSGYQGNEELKKKIEIQFTSMAYYIAKDCASEKESIQFEKLMDFLKSKAIFDRSTLSILRFIHKLLIRKRRFYVHRFILRKLNEYLSNKFQPIIKQGYFLKVADFN